MADKDFFDFNKDGKLDPVEKFAKADFLVSTFYPEVKEKVISEKQKKADIVDENTTRPENKDVVTISESTIHAFELIWIMLMLIGYIGKIPSLFCFSLIIGGIIALIFRCLKV